MEVPLRLRRVAFSLLWLALIAQTAWLVLQHFRLHQTWASMWYPLTFAGPFLLLALTKGRVRWVASLLRLPIALAFLDAVGDRLGFLGAPGSPGVSWGDFTHFIAYTGRVNSFMPRSTIPALAVVATILEVVFGIAMLLGIRIPVAAIGSAVLLALFGTAMTASGLSQFAYGVFLMSAGALALSTVDASLLSADRLLQSRIKETPDGQ